MNRRFWRSGELRVVRDHYPVGGVAACAALLPGRSESAIEAVASRLGVRSPNRGGRRTKITLTPAQQAVMDALLRGPIRRGDVSAAARAAGLNMRTVQSWLVRAGADRCAAAQPWTEAQDAVLREHADARPEQMCRILHAQCGVRRTPHAVYKRAGKLRLRGMIDRTTYSQAGLTRLLGFTEWTVQRAVASGALAAPRYQPLFRRPRRSVARPAPQYAIPRRAVRTWLRAQPDLLARARHTADRTWLADLLGELPQTLSPHIGRPDEGLAEHHLEAA